MPSEVVLSSYDPRWPAQFGRAAAQLQSVFGDEAVAIHHMGSTAIPGLKARPILDILIEVRDLARVNGLNGALSQLGYRAIGENGVPGQRYFTLSASGPRDPPGQRAQYVHVFQTGHPEIARLLNFRDYLRAHPQAVRIYEAMKLQKAQQFAHDSAQYTEAKTQLVHQIDVRAAAWREDQ